MIALLAALAVGFAISGWLYSRREPAVRGRVLLAVLRGSALGLILFLLLDPPRPFPRPLGASDPVLLVDGSPSMDAESGADRPRARAAADRILGDAESAGQRTLRFGGRDGGVDGRPRTLEEAVEGAAVQGASALRVVSDLRLEGAESAVGRARELGLRIDFEDVGGPFRNVGIAGVRAPQSVREGEPIRAEVRVASEGIGAGEEGTIEVTGPDGALRLTRPVRFEPGSSASLVALEWAPAPGPGFLRYEVRVRIPGDAFPDDDARGLRISVDEPEGGIVLLSLRPDWEPRTLLPLLADATGLPARGYLRIGPGRYLRMAQGDEPGGREATEEDVRRAADRAELLVVHGSTPEDPEWVRARVSEARRLLLFPAAAGGAASVGVALSGPVPGEWYPDPELPRSPIAPSLTGIPQSVLPPLGPLLLIREAPPEQEIPLSLRMAARGTAEPALVLREEADGSRRAFSLVTGWWRWALREGPPRDAYGRVWAATAGWLLDDEGAPWGSEIRPAARVALRDRPLEWIAPGLAGDSIRLRVEAGDAVVADTLLRIGPDFRARIPPLPPGSYRWSATALPGPPDGDSASGGIVGAEAGGEFDVDRWTPDAQLPWIDPEALLRDATAAGAVPAHPSAGAAARPLRLASWPWLLALGLLCAEWILRRRRGLR